MIYTKRYDNGQTPIAGELEFTERIENIQNPLENIAEGYYMGYVKYSDFPKCHGFSVVTAPPPDTSYKIGFTTPKQNYNWGFVNFEYYAQDTQTYTLLYMYDNDSIIRRSCSYYNRGEARFINKAIMAKANYPDKCALQYHYMFIRNDCYDFNGTLSNFNPDNSGSTTANLYNVVSYTENKTYAEIKNIVDNNGIIYTVNATVNGVSVSVDVRPSDFNEYNMCIKTVANDYALCFIISGFELSQYSKYYGYSSSAVPIVPFFGVTIPENTGFEAQENAVLIPCGAINSYLYFRFRNGNWGDCKVYDYGANNQIGSGLYYGCFPYDEFDSQAALAEIIHNPLGGADYGMGTNRSGIYKQKIFIKYVSGGNVLTYNFYQQINIEDVLKAFQFLNKIESGVSNWDDVTPENTYYSTHTTAIFNSDNSPTNTRQSKNYGELQTALQLWQKIDIQIITNEYDPADLPPYDPTPGGDAENVGDSVIRPSSLGVGGTNGFVTQYALNAAQVQTLGEILWTSIFDTDYWQNYMFSLALDTGSFNVSSILSFFISLKVYPFALINVPSFDIWGNNMYIGTGLKPLAFSTVLHSINNYCDYVSGGSITVDSDNFYNDYRDYINAKYTLYVPYCGTVELNPGDVVGNTITLQYAVDFATGGCIGYVDVNTRDGKQFTIAALPGQMGADIPLTSTAAGQVAARFVGDAMKFGGLLGGEVAGVASGIWGGLGDADSSSIHGVSGGSVLSGFAGMYGGLPAAMGTDLAAPVTMQAMNMINRGAISAPMLSGGRGFASFGSPQTAYVQIRRGIYPEISGLKTVSGSPCAGTYTVGDLSGFVQGDVKTNGLTCPENEKQKIRRLLAGGIYV